MTKEGSPAARKKAVKGSRPFDAKKSDRAGNQI